LEGGKVGTQLINNYLLTTVRSSEIGELGKSRIKPYIDKWYVKEASIRILILIIFLLLNNLLILNKIAKKAIKLIKTKTSR